MRTSAFVLKHLIAASLVVFGLVLLVSGIYFALLVWAIVTNQPLGGPLALPGMILFTFAFSLASVLLLLAPATAFAEVVRLRIASRNRFVEVSLATFNLILAVAVGFLVLLFARGWSFKSAVQPAAWLLVFELVALGGYWWSLQATELLMAIIRRLWHFVSHHVRARVTAG
jgi:hypothetical protein